LQGGEYACFVAGKDEWSSEGRTEDWTICIKWRPEPEWIRWKGRSCPVPDYYLVEVKTKFGNEHINKASHSDWKCGSITAYRILETECDTK